MRSTERLKCLAVVASILLFGCAAVYCRHEEPPGPDPLLCLPISDKDSFGSSIPVSENEVFTVAHCVQSRTDLFVGVVWIFDPENRIKVAGRPATQTSVCILDNVAIRLRIKERFPKWLEPGKAAAGTAYVLRPDKVEKITITDVTGQTFSGWQPFLGSSGTGMIQWQNGKWRVVGVIRGRICDNCKFCHQQIRCHCPGMGFYARSPG